MRAFEFNLRPVQMSHETPTPTSFAETTPETPSPNENSNSILPLHHPEKAAQQAPFGNATNNAVNKGPGMGAKALLARKIMPQNPMFVSPTDTFQTPCTRRLAAAKKHPKPLMPVSLFTKPNGKPLEKEQSDDDDDERMTPNEPDLSPIAPLEGQRAELVEDPDNPF